MRHFMKILAVLAAIQLAVASASAQQTVEPEKRAVIIKLMQMTGASDIGLQFGDMIVGQMIPMMKRQNPEWPDRVFEIISEVIHDTFEANVTDMIEQLIPLYDRHFTVSELNDMITFYQTPTGQKAISTMPTILQESSAAGQAWSQKITPIAIQRLQQRLKEEGLEGFQ
ncbi:MAG: DUF2059 domain-containing protein [Phycisphaerae bacterium]